jgi:type VI secretion system secreted protein Hcp
MAVDYFIKFDGIKGESTDAKHKDEIDVESWSWGETQTGPQHPGGGGGAGKVAMQDFHFVMRLNTASPGLMRACATGQHIKTATLYGRKAGKNQQEYLTFKLTDVLVSSYQTGGSEQADIPIDQVSLNFAKIQVEYKPQRPDGTPGSAVTFGWDVKAGKSL